MIMHSKAANLAYSVIIMSLLFTRPVLAQSDTPTPSARLSINAIDSQVFPKVETFVSVTDVQGFPIAGLSKDDFQLFEDGKQVTDFEAVPFTNISQPLAIALTIDTSGSMGEGYPSRLDNAITAGLDFINTLESQDQVALISFSDKVITEQTLTTDRVVLQSGLQKLKAVGGTKLNDAVVEAVSLLKSRSERKAIVLLTDGRDMSSKFKDDEVIDEAARWGIPVYPLGFGDIDREKLEKLAQLTGGAAQFQPDSTSLQTAFKTFLNILREQYRINFTSTLGADGKEHTLSIKLKYQGTEFSTDGSFKATPGEVSFYLEGLKDGGIVDGKVLFKPIVTAPAAIGRVEIAMDGKPLNVALKEPFEYVWESEPTGIDKPGPHVFTVKVVDKANNSTEKQITLDVKSPIKVTILSPSEGAQVQGKIKFSAQVDTLGSVNAVEFLLDKTPYPYSQSLEGDGKTYEAEWDSARAAANAHILEVKAQDARGYISEARVGFTVGIQDPYGWLWVALISVSVVAAIIIPIGIRNRKHRIQGSISGLAGKTPGIPSGPAAMTKGTPVLVELAGRNPGRIWPINTPEIRLGRKSDDNDITLQGLSASRRHALLRRVDGDIVIWSLAPDNPVAVNGKPIAQQQTLQPGDVLELGESRFRFEIQA